MLMVVGLVQFVAYQYTRGALVTALERGVRAGALVGAGAPECRAALADSLAEVLGGTVGTTVTVTCGADAEQVWARATGTFPAWLSGGPDLALDLEAIARREVGP